MANREESLDVFEVATGKKVQSFSALGYVSKLAFSPDGNLLAAQGPSAALLVYDLRTGKELHPHEGLLGWVGDAAFSTAGQHMATIDAADRYLVVWDLASRRPVGRAPIGEPLYVNRVCRPLIGSPRTRRIAIVRRWT